MAISLEDIIIHKRREIAEARDVTSLEALKEQAAGVAPARNFFGAVANGRGPGGINVIAEVKAKSPSALRVSLYSTKMLAPWRFHA